MYLKTRNSPCVRAHIGNLINYMRTDTKDLLTNRFGGNGIKTVRLHSDHFTEVLAELIIIRRSKYSTIFNYKTKKTNFLHTNLKQHHLVIKIFNKQSFQP